MTNIAKLLIGAGATSLLAWGAHSTYGPRYIENMGDGASAALAEADITGIDAAMQTDPLSRTVVLTGEGLSDAQRAAAEEAVRKVRGVADVSWPGYDDDPDGDTGADGASAAAVAACQDDVDKVLAEKTINFRSGSPYMPDSSRAVVKEVAEALKPCKGVALEVGGHTDATGSDAINKSMSEERARVVKEALVENGLAAENITAKGYGSSKLKVPGDGANRENRRIEFTLAGKAPSGTTEADTTSGQEGED